jgi:hypothetical protein
MPCHFGHAESLIEGLGAGADAAGLMIGVEFDAREVDLAGAVLDVEHADVRPADRDDLPAGRIEGARVEDTLDLLLPPPDGGDVAAHGGPVQLGSRTHCRPGAGRSATGGMPPVGHQALAAVPVPACSGDRRRSSAASRSLTVPHSVAITEYIAESRNRPSSPGAHDIE